jgi:hypothetical protein
MTLLKRLVFDISESLTAFAEAHPEVLKRSKEIGERWMKESRASEASKSVDS